MPKAIPPWQGFAFNPEGIGAWSEAKSRHELGYGEPLAQMIRAGSTMPREARDYLATFAEQSPRAGGRPTKAALAARVDPGDPNAWRDALTLHAADSRTEVARMLRSDAAVADEARSLLSAIALGSAYRKPGHASAEWGSDDRAAMLYRDREVYRLFTHHLYRLFEVSWMDSSR